MKKYSQPPAAGVKGGAINDDALVLKTPIGEYTIPWVEVEYVFLCRIEPARDSSSPFKKSADRLSRGLMSTRLPKHDRGGRDPVSTRKVKLAESFLGYVFAKDRAQAFRFDTVGTNFKELLGKDAGYVAAINFNNAFRRIIEKSPNATLDPSAADFYQKGKKFLHAYESKSKAWQQALEKKSKGLGIQDDGDTYKVSLD